MSGENGEWDPTVDFDVDKGRKKNPSNEQEGGERMPPDGFPTPQIREREEEEPNDQPPPPPPGTDIPPLPDWRKPNPTEYEN